MISVKVRIFFFLATVSLVGGGLFGEITNPVDFAQNMKAVVDNTLSGTSCTDEEAPLLQEYSAQARLLKQTYIDIISQIDDALEYWRQQKYQPTWYAFNKGPIGWYKHAAGLVKSDQEIAESIAKLESFLVYYTQLLGSLDPVMQKVPASMAHDTLIDPEQYPWIAEYKKDACAAFESLKRPSHLQRHWVKYAVGASVSGLIAAYMYAKKDTIANTIVGLQNGVDDLYKTHLKNPLDEFKALLLGKESTGNAPLIDTEQKREALDAKFKSFSVQQRSYLKDAIASAASEWRLSDSDQATLFNAIDGADFNTVTLLIRKQWADNVSDMSSKNPYTAYRALTKGIQTFMIQKDVTFAWISTWLDSLFGLVLHDVWGAVEKRIRRVEASQRINVIMLTALPTLGAVVLSGIGIKKLFGLFKRKAKDYQPLRMVLLEISKILNRYHGSESVQGDMSPADNGFLIYLYARMEMHSHMLLTDSLKDSVLADLKELSEPERLITQKLGVVDRMYRTYAFLAPVQKIP